MATVPVSEEHCTWHHWPSSGHASASSGVCFLCMSGALQGTANPARPQDCRADGAPRMSPALWMHPCQHGATEQALSTVQASDDISSNDLHAQRRKEIRGLLCLLPAPASYLPLISQANDNVWMLGLPRHSLLIRCDSGIYFFSLFSFSHITRAGPQLPSSSNPPDSASES